MTNLQLLEAIGMIDEETILDAEQIPAPTPLAVRRRRTWRQLSVIAACVCLLIGGAVAARMSASGGSRDGIPDASSPTEGLVTTADRADGITGAWDEIRGEDGSNRESPEVTTGTTVRETTLSGAMPTYATTASATPTYATSTTYDARPSDDDIGVDIPAYAWLIYSEDFDDFGDTPLTTEVPIAFDWTRLTVDGDGAYGESDVLFALSGGRLYFRNDTSGAGYYAISQLNDDYMKPIAIGKYTLQYDIEYLLGDADAYAALVTEYSEDGKCYNQFALRVRGKGNHQCHFYGSWKRFACYDPDIDLNPEAEDPSGAEGTTILQKLAGAGSPELQDLTGVRLTVRLQWNPEMGHHVYLKTAEMTDFVKVSAPSEKADGFMYICWDGWSVAFKVMGRVEGYLDNIRIWTGWSDGPDARGEVYRAIE